MLACLPSATLHGVDGRSVSVEVHVSAGLPGFTVVGLPDAAVRESRDRVRAALLSSGLGWPSRRVTVNLAPSRYRLGKPDRGEGLPSSGLDDGLICPVLSSKAAHRYTRGGCGTRVWFNIRTPDPDRHNRATHARGVIVRT